MHVQLYKEQTEEPVSLLKFQDSFSKNLTCIFILLSLMIAVKIVIIYNFNIKMKYSDDDDEEEKIETERYLHQRKAEYVRESMHNDGL